MVEGQFWSLGYREPLGIRRVGRSSGLMRRKFHQRVIGDTHHALARVASDRAEGAELLEKHLLQASLFLEFTARGVLECLVDSNKSSRQRPFPFEWLQSALNQQNLQFCFIKPEHDTVHGKRRARIFVGKPSL